MLEVLFSIITACFIVITVTLLCLTVLLLIASVLIIVGLVLFLIFTGVLFLTAETFEFWSRTRMWLHAKFIQ